NIPLFYHVNPPTDTYTLPYTTLFRSFQVQDNGGTANGGVDLDQSPNTMTINVTSVNDAPAGTDNTVTTSEDTAHTFTAADFGFTDRKSTRLNSSHVAISYAVFCVKKK